MSIEWWRNQIEVLYFWNIDAVSDVLQFHTKLIIPSLLMILWPTTNEDFFVIKHSAQRSWFSSWVLVRNDKSSQTLSTTYTIIIRELLSPTCSSQYNPKTKHSVGKEGEKLSWHCLNLSEYAANMLFSNSCKNILREIHVMIFMLILAKLYDLLEARVSIILWPNDLLAKKSLKTEAALL